MQLFSLALASALLAQSTASPDKSASTAEQAIAVPVTVEFTTKKAKKITDRNHPDYVRCRSKPVIGSLAKKERICMKNKEWKAANLEGSKRSKQLVEDLQVGMNNNGM